MRSAALLVICACTLLAWGRAWAQDAPPLYEPTRGFHVGGGDSAHFAAAAAAGGRFAVVVFSWRDIQPTPDTLYWETPDAVLRAAEYYGQEVVARIDRPPDWARAEGGPAPWDLDSYANFARSVALRYHENLGGVILWNEPNLALEWDGRPPDPAGYTALLKAGYSAVKSVAPELPVLAAGLAFTAGDGTAAYNDLAFLEHMYAAGAGAYFDILAAHPYGFGQPPGQPPAADTLNFRRIELHRGVMAANGDGSKPIWITEMGWRTSAPPADRWQVVTPAQQRTYTLAALNWVRRYPWLQRLAFWELNRGDDLYGYALWGGPGRSTPAYRALVARAPQTLPAARAAVAAPVEILAPDVTIRLGDRGELHPHWVHLHRGGRLFSPDWRGEFFLTGAPEVSSFDLVLETMQVDQPTNRIAINGVPLGALRPRSRLDPTSTWVTQRLSVPPSVLKQGANEIVIASGARLPVRQHRWWRWENFQFRNIRLDAHFVFPKPTIRWQEMPAEAAGVLTGTPTAARAGAPPASPGGWAETNRLRMIETEDVLWLTANRSGQIWQLDARSGAAPVRLQPEQQGAGERIFLDVAATDAGLQVVATDAGLRWRQGATAWRPVQRAPAAYATVVIQQGGAWYAGFATQGVWTAQAPYGPWQPLGLAGRTVLDLAAGKEGQVYAAADNGVYLFTAGSWRRLPALPPAGEEGDPAQANFVGRLWLGPRGELVVRSEDRLFRWASPQSEESSLSGGMWQPFGPAKLQGRLLALARCCDAGALAGTNGRGIWQQEALGTWRRIDGGVFDNLEINDLATAGARAYAGTANGLFAQTDSGAWRKVDGLPATITDLLTSPQDPNLWVAATPAGVYRSTDGGGSWHAISPPWVVWDLAWAPAGVLWAARSAGVALTGDVAGDTDVRWQTPTSMDTVLFFTVSPDPDTPGAMWGGTWGNDIGVASGDAPDAGEPGDGGTVLQPLHNGLETLSVLAILRHPTPGQYTIGTIAGLFRSDDRGETWFKLPGPLTEQTIYSLHQDVRGILWAGAADGLWRSDDYGATWRRIAPLPPTAVIRVGDVQRAGRPLLWAGTEDSGLWLSGDGGETWQFGGLAGRSVYALIADPVNDRLVAATDAGLNAGR
jgi:hypothetical protein